MGPQLKLGHVVRLRKAHPCGGFEWEIVRVGADVGLKCLICGRRILLSRAEFHKRMKSIAPPEVSG